ncbi:MAG: potassium transporter Kup [Chitinivibrionales bacterium]|nr:potassium transporter Kup [Chitinivibrionales bacterium]
MSDTIPAPENAVQPQKSQAHETKTALTLAALGVVFGDIGTSPLYSLRECFSGIHAIALSQENVLGAVSLIFWFLVIIVSVKYITFVMRSDNKGEGGILALMALVHQFGPQRVRNLTIISLLGILGAALLFSDGIITPAISVLSAVEGLQVATTRLKPLIVPISLIILALLFIFQSRGTGKIGSFFGPILLLWFVTIGILGFFSLVRCPKILYAVNPLHAIGLLMTLGWRSFFLLSTTFLSVTGAEILYADMGHFGRFPIRNAWFFIVFPSLILCYFGQGACLLQLHTVPVNAFFQMAPTWFVYPLVIIATTATVIASQAVISGAFSLARQAVQFGYWPRLRVVHTSTSHIGQVYIPFINYALFSAILVLIMTFKGSGNLASVYGIANSVTMFITTILVLLLARSLWRVPRTLVIIVGALFLFIDLALVVANCFKLFAGGWIVVLMAAAVCIFMTTWISGRRILQQRVHDDSLPLNQFITDISDHETVRIEKTAVFLSSNAQYVPRALLHNFKHNGVIARQTLIVSVENEETPFVSSLDRCTATRCGQGIYTVVIKYGFMESPDIPAVLSRMKIPGLVLNTSQLSYFLGKETLVISQKPSMHLWRKQLFHFMTRNSLGASTFFQLPPNQVIELGVQIEL